jgi:hypothetical protein
MKAQRRVEAQLHTFFMQHYKEMSMQFHSPIALLPGKEACSPWTAAWFNARANLGALKKRKNLLPLLGIETLTLTCPGHTLDAVLSFKGRLYKIIQEDTQSYT